jgi:cell division transport system permease protein
VSETAPRPERRRPAPLLPGRDARDGSLVFVVATLCFLACLAALAAIGADRAARGWRTDLTGSATVVVRPKADETADAAAARAAETLSGVKGVIEADALEREKAEALLEPWLGDETILHELPVPRLVSVDLDPKAPASAGAMDQALKAAGVDATVDDHSLWLKDILRAAALTRAAAIGVAALIAAAAAAVIVFATRAGLAARGDVVSVLHLAGAEDGFIADLFVVRFARMAALAGLIAALGAAVIGATARTAGGGEGLVAVLPLAWSDLVVLPVCPLVAAAIAAIAARATALRLLKEMT